MSDDIVVEARQVEALRDFVARLADANRSGQLARWDNRVCAGLVGLETTQAEFVNARIGEAARLAHLTLAPAGCQPTALMIVTSDATALAAAFAKRYPNTLAVDGRRQLTRFTASRRPVRWVSETDILPHDGSPLARFPGQIDQGRLPNTRLKPATRATVSYMLVIIDATQLGDVKLGALADYLALVILTRPRLGDDPPARSVLSLFDSGGEREGLTDTDRQYLAAYYTAPRDRDAAAQRDAIRRSMQRADSNHAAGTTPPR